MVARGMHSQCISPPLSYSSYVGKPKGTRREFITTAGSVIFSELADFVSRDRSYSPKHVCAY